MKSPQTRRNMMDYGIYIVIIGLISFNSDVLAARNSQPQGRSIAGNGKQAQQQNLAPDFTCPEEFGYFPHPEDCSLYYVCVFGGALLESCTGGLMYSHDLQTCDWPRNVLCGLQPASNNQTASSAYAYDVEDRPRLVDTIRDRDYTITRSQQLSSKKPTEINQQRNSDNSDLISNIPSTSPKYTNSIRFQDDNQADGSRLGRSYEQNVPNYKEEIYAANAGSRMSHNIVKRQTHYYGPNPGPGHDNMYPSSYWRQRDLHYGTYAHQHHRFVKAQPSTKTTLVTEHLNTANQHRNTNQNTNHNSNHNHNHINNNIQAHTKMNSNRNQNPHQNNHRFHFGQQQASLVPTSSSPSATTMSTLNSLTRQQSRHPHHNYNHNHLHVQSHHHNPSHHHHPHSNQHQHQNQNQHQNQHQSSVQVQRKPIQLPIQLPIRPEEPESDLLPHEDSLEVSYEDHDPNHDSLENHHHRPEEDGDESTRSQAPLQQQRQQLPLKMYHENVNHRLVIPRTTVPSSLLTTNKPIIQYLDGFQPSTYWTREENGGGSAHSGNSNSHTDESDTTVTEHGHLTRTNPSNNPMTLDDDISVNGGSGKTPGGHTSQQEIIIDPEYLSQRHAANVPPQQQQPAAGNASNLYYDDSYYIYEDEKEEPQYDDVDYKSTQQRQPQQEIQREQKPVVIPTTTTTTRRPTPPVLPSSSKPTSRTSSRGSARHKSSSGSRPTLKPSSSIVKDVQDSVRDVYVDLPSRPAPVYETNVPNTPASKCRKDECLLPDCFCGGKDIPAGLPAATVPQIVLLTFDDSVNDLNKDLYRDLFEKGRKNPNGCPIGATFYVSHEWTDYSQVQNLAADGHEIASHSISHSFGEQFSQKKWDKEINGQREILAAYGGVKLDDVRGMRAPFLAVGGNNMFKMLYDSNFTYDSSMPVYENKPPSWPYTLDYRIFHDCMIPPCPTKSYPGVWEVPMVMWQDLKGGRCSMGDACSNPPTAEGVYNMLAKNFERHYTTNRAPFGLYYHAAWFTQPHHKEGFEAFLDTLVNMDDVFILTNWQALQWVRDPTPLNRVLNFEPWNCHNTKNRPRRCNHPRVCNLWHKSGVRYMKTCQQCPSQYPWVGSTGIPVSNSL